MTQEEKAKAYDEALERARKIHSEIVNNEIIGFPGQIEGIFPQLRETEDERVIKWIAKYIHSGVFNEEEHPMALKAIEWLEKQKEQKPAEWSEDIIQKAVKEVGLTQRQIDWFKNNVFPPKQEWSKEDEEHRKSIISTIEMCMNDSESATSVLGYYESDIAWLKSLRPQKDCSACSKNLEDYINGRCDAENKLLEQFGAVIMPEGELRIRPRFEPNTQRTTKDD